MCSIISISEDKEFKQITWENRQVIEHLYNIQKKNFTEIGDEIGKHRTSIGREIRLGLVELETTMCTTRWIYCAETAQRNNEMNETAKGPTLKIGSDIKLAKYIEDEIRDKKSPEVIANAIEKSEEYKIKLHWKTIYNYIDKNILEIERNDLTYGNYNKKVKEEKKENEVRKLKKAGKTIHDRPIEIDNREELGHWEMDLVEGRKGMSEPYLLVLSERKSRKEIIKLLPDKTQNSVITALNSMERELGVVKFRETFKTIITDNGSEFLNWEAIEKSYTGSKIKRTTQYYADAYSSWQRGTNENINKMIRRFLPKGTSFKNLTKEEVQRIETWINNYPRKMFNFKTSNEIYQEELAELRVA